PYKPRASRRPTRRSYSRSSSSRSISRGGERRRRSRSRDRSRGGRRRVSRRDEPDPSHVLGVFNLSLRTTEKDLQLIFERYGRVNQVTIVYDHRSDRSRGFGFVYMNSVEEATIAKEKTNGMELNGRNMRVDYSLTQRPHTPTPGEYMEEERLHALGAEAGQGIEEEPAAAVIQGVEEDRIAALEDPVATLAEYRPKRVNENFEIRFKRIFDFEGLHYPVNFQFQPGKSLSKIQEVHSYGNKSIERKPNITRDLTFLA
ncbi:25916_t:CDS:2, partial [Dentiscutata erythropus]